MSGRRASTQAILDAAIAVIGTEPAFTSKTKAADLVRPREPLEAPVMIGTVTVPRRELVTLLAYLQAGSHRRGAHRLGISESTSRQRISQLMGRLGVDSVGQAIWVLRHELDAEVAADGRRRPVPRVTLEADARGGAGPD